MDTTETTQDIAPGADDGINWAALARAGYIGFFGSDDDWDDEPAKHLWVREARAVVAALADQGMVVVRRGLLDIARCELDSHESGGGGSVFWREVDEIDAALAAGGDEEETDHVH